MASTSKKNPGRLLDVDARQVFNEKLGNWLRGPKSKSLGKQRWSADVSS
jgi:hypothetical protein